MMSILDEDNPTRTSVSGHFRVWKDVYDSLEDEARVRQVSLNTLVNQLLSRYTRDESMYERLGVVTLPKETYRLMLQLIPDDKLDEFALESIKGWPMNLMLARNGIINTDAVLNQLRDFSKLGFLSFYETSRNGTKVISLNHEFGPKFTRVLAAGVTGLFKLVNIHPSVTATDSSVTIEY